MIVIPPLLLRALSWAAIALALGCAAVVLVGQGGRWSARFDVLNHFTPVWLVLALVALCLWLAAGRRDWWAPALAGFAILVCLIQIAPELMARRGSVPAPGAEQLKVIQFNAWSRNTDPDATIAWLVAQKADIVILEEALGAPEIAHTLKRAYPFRRTCAGITYCEIEIFSRARPIAWQGLVPSIGVPAAWVTYEGAGGPFTVAAIHAPWPWPPGPQQYEGELFAKALEDLPKDRMIVTGDFNSTPWSFSLRRQDRLFGLERRTHGVASWPARAYHDKLPFDPPFPILPIDQVYAGKGWKTVSITRGPKLGSDHYPIIAILQAAP